MKEYNFYSDDGHGWLAVKRQELLKLGIANEISPYSYQRGDTVYLEEDSDYTTFFNAKQHCGEKILFNEVYHNGSSWIRSLERYKHEPVYA